MMRADRVANLEEAGVSGPQHGVSSMSPNEISMPVWDEKHLRAATRAAGVALWSWNVDTDAITMDERAYDLWDVSKDEQNITFEILSQNIHPADLERVRSAFSATRAVVGAYEIDFRILSGNDIRWISARGQGDDADIADRIMFGIFLDVTQRKQAEEANELLAGEMSHRVKNLLQIASALTQITSRSAATKEDMVRDLTSRLMVLGRAQDLVRPGPGGDEAVDQCEAASIARSERIDEEEGKLNQGVGEMFSAARTASVQPSGWAAMSSSARRRMLGTRLCRVPSHSLSHDLANACMAASRVGS